MSCRLIPQNLALAEIGLPSSVRAGCGLRCVLPMQNSTYAGFGLCRNWPTICANVKRPAAIAFERNHRSSNSSNGQFGVLKERLGRAKKRRKPLALPRRESSSPSTVSVARGISSFRNSIKPKKTQVRHELPIKFICDNISNPLSRYSSFRKTPSMLIPAAPLTRDHVLTSSEGMFLFETTQARQ